MRHVKMCFSLLLLHRLFPLKYVFTHIISLVQQGNYDWILIKVSTRVIQKNTKSQSKGYVRKAFKVFITEEYFSENCKPMVFGLPNYREQLSFVTSYWVHASLTEMPHFSWQNNFSDWKATCYIKQKFFLQFFSGKISYICRSDFKICTPNKKYVFKK